MSILFQSNNCSLLDHRDFICNLYKNIAIDEHQTLSLVILSSLFSIKSDIKQVTTRKRSRSSVEMRNETINIKQMYEKFRLEIQDGIIRNTNKKYNLMDTTEVRDLSIHLFESTVFDHVGVSGGNNSDVPLRCRVKGEYFLVPQKSRFFCGCVKEQCQKLDGTKFDIVIADPPWWNKYIRRLKGANDKLSYTMMYNEDIAAIPVKNLLSSNCLVAVWCTNAPSNIAAVKDIIFPAWGIRYLTTWYWLKVTIDYQPLCSFGAGSRKQPYERVILGAVGQVAGLPVESLFVSVPSALHSHKPPLLDLLSPYVKMENPQTLELFARYLLPNTTSVGYEPLKWQHQSLYEEVT